MEQTRLESLAESAIDIAFGFITSVLVWMYIVGPIVGVDTHASQALWVTAIFTVTSLLRRYLTRRFFARRLHKEVHIFVTKWLQNGGKSV